jgi:hypothetical protein
MPLSAAEHARVRAETRARRNARTRERRRRGLTPVLRWERAPGGYRRCLVCGRWCSEGQTAGRTGPLRFCEGCWIVAELRRALGRGAA